MDTIKNLLKRLSGFPAAINSNRGQIPSESIQHLLGLPQEIQDIIFDYAYYPPDNFKTIGRVSWELQEESNRKNYGPEYIIRPFPPPKVAEFLVSRCFFLNAGRAFIGQQVIMDPSKHYSISQRRYNIILEFVTEAIIDFYALKYLFDSCKVGPNLKKLTIKTSDHELEMSKTKFLW